MVRKREKTAEVMEKTANRLWLAIAGPVLLLVVAITTARRKAKGRYE